MTPCTRRSAVIALIVALAMPAWGQQYYLYAPKPATPADRPADKRDGVLVEDIEIHKGDTLYGLSKRFNGRGMYYPQILLFNNIKNPNLIYPGDILKVPLSGKATAPDQGRTNSSEAPSSSATPSHKADQPLEAAVPGSGRQETELATSDIKPAGASKSSGRKKRKDAILARKSSAGKKSSAESRHAEITPPLQQAATVNSPAASAESGQSGQKLFEAGVKAYRQDDCRTALELLDRYLADNSSSPLAADAALYKAECFLKLSAQ